MNIESLRYSPDGHPAARRNSWWVILVVEKVRCGLRVGSEVLQESLKEARHAKTFIRPHCCGQTIGPKKTTLRTSACSQILFHIIGCIKEGAYAVNLFQIWSKKRRTSCKHSIVTTVILLSIVISIKTLSMYNTTSLIHYQGSILLGFGFLKVCSLCNHPDVAFHLSFQREYEKVCEW